MKACNNIYLLQQKKFENNRVELKKKSAVKPALNFSWNSGLTHFVWKQKRNKLMWGKNAQFFDNVRTLNLFDIFKTKEHRKLR